MQASMRKDAGLAGKLLRTVLIGGVRKTLWKLSARSCSDEGASFWSGSNSLSQCGEIRTGVRESGTEIASYWQSPRFSPLGTGAVLFQVRD